jgi:hypothetical protein
MCRGSLLHPGISGWEMLAASLYTDEHYSVNITIRTDGFSEKPDNRRKRMYQIFLDKTPANDDVHDMFSPWTGIA